MIRLEKLESCDYPTLISWKLERKVNGQTWTAINMVLDIEEWVKNKAPQRAEGY
ncbi:MAG TPA: hypothetical protein VEV87_03695 [Chitinophagaceae bacterium]|nr:hypothetical protein [Chitinophagaceae bacterium]